MPTSRENMIYWYGFSNATNTVWHSEGYQGTATNTPYTNYIEQYSSYFSCATVRSANMIDLTPFNNAKTIVSATSYSGNLDIVLAVATKSLENELMKGSSNFIPLAGVRENEISLGTKYLLTGDVSSKTDNAYVFTTNYQSWNPQSSTTSKLYALWLE